MCFYRLWVNEWYRKQQNKKKKAVEVEEAGQCSPSSHSSFSNEQMLHRSLFRADNHLPKSPHRKAEVIKKLVEKNHMKIPFNTNCGRPQKYKKKNSLKHSCFAVKSTAPILEGKTMYMLVKLIANVAVSNVCIYCEIFGIFWTSWTVQGK